MFGRRALIETAAEIWQGSPEELAFQHVVVAHLNFPRSKSDVHEFSRTRGTTLLLLQAGKLWTGTSWEDRPQPYGSVPRLMTIAITTRAIQQKTRSIVLGRSMSENLCDWGLPIPARRTGGASGAKPNASRPCT